MTSQPITVRRGGEQACDLVIIGSSTGGTRILPLIFQELQVLRAAVLIVQHMPRFINQSFVRSLGQSSLMPVQLAEDGAEMFPGAVWVAPSEVHCSVVHNRRLRLWSGEKVNYVCPSIDVTMQSLSRPSSGERFWGVILTGMGQDGAAGLVYIKGLGGITIAQDKASSAIYGMPAQAVKTGCVDHVLNPREISRRLNQTLGSGSRLPKKVA